MTCRAEFQANTHTSNKQENPAIAIDDSGNFVVVWNSYLQDGSSNGVFGRRFDPNCKPLSEEFQINTTTSGNQREPSVAMDAAGNFVVAWYGPGIVEEDKEDIFARRFDPNAIPISSEFRVNDDPNGRQLHPKVAMSSSGAFAIVWENNEFYPQIDGYEVLYKLYDCNGTSIRTDKANLLTQCRYPDAAMNDNGDFVIVWMQDDIYHTSNIIMFRQYSKDGTSKADPCQVSTTNFFTIAHPSVSANGTGYFIVVWDGNPGPADQDNILARRFKFDGMAANMLDETEALLRLCRELYSISDEMYISLTTGTWASPFWLLHADSVWRGGGDMGFHGKGSRREQWLTYRDKFTYQNMVKAGPLYPLNSFMNQGIAHAIWGSANLPSNSVEFAHEVYSFFGIGTSLQELYISHGRMTDQMWDILAEGAKWSRRNSDVLVDTHWIGGNPDKLEVYGCASWRNNRAIVMLRNPDDKKQTITLDIRQALDLPPFADTKYTFKSAWQKDKEKQSLILKAGDPHTFELAPFEVLVLESAQSQ